MTVNLAKHPARPAARALNSMASGSALAEAQGTDLDLPCRPAAYAQPNRDFPNDMDKTMGF
jgi:hypothetical protein